MLHPQKHPRPETMEVTEPFSKNPLQWTGCVLEAWRENRTNHCSCSQVESTGATILIDPLMRKGVDGSDDFFQQINKKAITWTSGAHWAHSPLENNIPTEQRRLNSTSYKEFTSRLHSGAETCISWFKGLLPFQACSLKMIPTLHKPTILLLKASDTAEITPKRGHYSPFYFQIVILAKKKKKCTSSAVLLVRALLRAQPLLSFSLERGKVQWELLVPTETPQG